MVEIIKEIGLPIVLALLTLIGLPSGILFYILTKPKTEAEVRQIDANIQGTIIEKLNQMIDDSDERIAKVEKRNDEIEEKYESRMKAMEARYEARIASLIAEFEGKLAEKDRLHMEAMREKDRIHADAITALEARINALSARIKHYEQMDVKVADVKDTIQGAADTLGNIKN